MPESLEGSQDFIPSLVEEAIKECLTATCLIQCPSEGYLTKWLNEIALSTLSCFYEGFRNEFVK